MANKNEHERGADPHTNRESVGGGRNPSGHRHDNAHKVKDPVCGMMVDPHTTQHKAETCGPDLVFLLCGMSHEVHG